MLRADDETVCSILTSSFVPGLMKTFNSSTIKIFLSVVREVPAERGISDPDAGLRLMFVESRCLMEGYIPTR